MALSGRLAGYSRAAGQEIKATWGLISGELWSRDPKRVLAVLLTLVAASTTAVYFYTAIWGTFSVMIQRSVLLIVALILAFALPIVEKKLPVWRVLLDLLLMVLAVITIVICIKFYLSMRQGEWGWTPATSDLVAGGILIVVVLEATRRLLGWSLVVLTVAAFAYLYFGNYMPGVFRNPGFDLSELVSYTTMSTTGLFGQPLYVASTIIFMFIALGKFLDVSGFGSLFIDLPLALFGRTRGGPAKVAVIGSYLFGTISGAAVSNVVMSGTFTIPLMKRVGYPGHTAGAIEAVASTGGQIMPPVMGTAAFIMADLLGIPYAAVVTAAILPATLYYFSLFITVDADAVRSGLKGLPKNQLPNARKVLAAGWYLLIPIAVLVYMIFEDYFLMKAAMAAILLIVVISWFSPKKVGPRQFFSAMQQTMRAMVTLTVALATAGIIVGLVQKSGLGLQLSSVLVDLSGGNLFVLLTLTGMVALILGMGLPTAAVYLFLAYLVGPALKAMGVPVLAAHLYIFYFGCLSAITPPDCIASFTAATIAKVNPWKVAWKACYIALPVYVMPYLFIYNPALIMRGTVTEILIAVLIMVPAIWAIVGGLSGYFLGRENLAERVLLVIGGALLVYPSIPTRLIGGAVLALLVLKQLLYRQKAPAVSRMPE